MAIEFDASIHQVTVSCPAGTKYYSPADNYVAVNKLGKPITGVYCGRCGDGIYMQDETDPDFYEECDFGDGKGIPRDNTTQGNGMVSGSYIIRQDEKGEYYCTDYCRREKLFCGDGITTEVPLEEQCDDGNDVLTDACVDCKDAYCGDGHTYEGQEECDDGNDSNDDNCVNCKDSRCGDGYTNRAKEECDDGNNAAGDGCGATCIVEECGNGIEDPGEACDDGNEDNTDNCTNACELPACGDGYVQGQEECDDDNTDAGDGCSAICLAENNICENVPRPEETAIVGSNQVGIGGDDWTSWAKQGGAYICVQGNILDQITMTSSNTWCSLSQADGLSHDSNKLFESRLKAILEELGYDHAIGGLYTKHGMLCGVEVVDNCWTCAWTRFSGCFAPESQIMMSDGNQKAIQDVSAGEFVYNPVTGRDIKVEKVIESPENVPMIELRTVDSRILKVTQEHPISTDAGIVKANTLQAGDLIEVTDGSYAELESVRELSIEAGQRVLNLVLEGDSNLTADNIKDRMLLADGIITGDLLVQHFIK